jgi:Rrf2 family transcriptional regulator, iron-sulfur cluster assembly transcription factor
VRDHDPSKLDKKVKNAIIRRNSEETDQMKISAHEEYGLRCLVQLARAEADSESLTLNQIADREGLSVANAGKLMWILVKAGLVQSQRGANGGYTLARPAADIRLNEVIRILDEDTVDGFCKTHTGVLDACIHTSECGIRPVIVGLHEIVQNALSEITLAELIGSEEKVDARVHQIQRLQTPLRSIRTAN